MDLLDYLAHLQQIPAQEAEQRWVQQHPLHPFSAFYFASAAPRSFAGNEMAALQALQNPQKEPERFCPQEIDEPVKVEIDAEELLSFFTRPTASFFKNSLGITYPSKEDPLQDTEPVELSGLERWQVGDAALASIQDGTPCPPEAFLWSGKLPPLAWGEAEWAQLRENLDPLIEQWQNRCDGAKALNIPPFTLEFSRHRLRCDPTGVYPQGLLRLTYSKLKGKNLLIFWIQHLLICAAPQAELNQTSYLIARGEKKTAVCLQLPPQPQPLSLLEDLIELFHLGQRRPLPLPINTAWAYAEAIFTGKTPEQAALLARKLWQGNPMSPGDQEDPYLLRAFGELGPDFTASEKADFSSLALQIFTPLLQALKES